MTGSLQPNPAESEAILTVCLLAAFADGAKSDSERAAVKKIAESLPNAGAERAELYQRVLLGQVSSAQAVQPLQRRELRQLAYEMAVCVCEADHILTQPEKLFLEQLRQLLQIESETATRIEHDAAALAFPDFSAGPSPTATKQSTSGAGTAPASGPDDDIEAMILNYAILNGAIELLPQSLSTMAIIPLQMKMVYRIGEKHGYKLDRGHIKELLAAAGVGLSSQVLEGYATKLFGGLFGALGGKLGRSLGNQAASSAMSFTATYAIGQMAQNYYAGGRTPSAIEMRRMFEQAKEKAASLYEKYAAQIHQRSQSIDTNQLLGLVRGQ